MAQVYSIDGVEILNRVRTTADPSGVEGLPSSAWYGEAMIAGVTVEDPDGELDLMGWHTFTHDETSCVGSERTFTGWITGKEISRGQGRKKDGAARIWDCEIIDQNAVWKLKLFRAASAQRPAETDNARMAFMLASAPMAATPVADNGRWNTTDNPTNFGAASYVAQYPIDLANSVAGVSGKNFYAYWSDADGEISGHYDLVGANPLSTVAISNVIADQDSTTVYPLIDAVLTRSPEDKVNGVLYQYLGQQYVYVQDTDLFGPGEFSPVNFDRDVLYSTDRVGRLDTANAQAAAQLAARSTEKDTLTVTVLLPPAQVNLLHAGMRVAARFSHLPGYEAEGGVELAVIRRNVIPPRVVGGNYTVHLELSNATAPTGPGGGDPGEFPPVVTVCEEGDLAIVASDKYDINSSTFDFTISPSPTVGNVVSIDVLTRDERVTAVPQGSWTMLTAGLGADGDGWAHAAITDQNYLIGRFAKVWTSLDDANVVFDLDNGGAAGDDRLCKAIVAEIEGVAIDGHITVVVENDVDTPNPINCGTVTTTGTSLLLGSASIAYNVGSTFTATADSPATELEEFFGSSRAPGWMGYYTVDDAASHGLSATRTSGGLPRGYAGVLTAFACIGGDAEAPCLAPGQPSPVDEAATPATGDGTTTTFTVRCPFADETLHVKVDNLNQDAAVVSYDGEAATFTLGYAPVAGEQVTVNYIGRAG